MTGDVVVVAVGAKTAVGLNARQTGFLLRAGYPAMAEAPLANEAGEPITMAFVPTLEGELTGAERLAALAKGPFEEAVTVVRDLAADVHVALDEPCDATPLASRLLKTTLERAMPQATVRVEARGEAAAAAWLPEAMRALAKRKVDVVVMGGAHSDYDPAAIAAVEAGGRLLSPDNLDARIPGEAAAFFVLMRTAEARRHGLASLARVLGVGGGRERARPDNDAPAYEALGLTQAVRQATETLATTRSTAGWIMTDLTSEMRRQREWDSVFVRAHKVLGQPYYLDSPAQRIGYLGAAAVPLFVVMAATAWKHGYAPSKVVLATAGNDGGERVAVVLGKA